LTDSFGEMLMTANQEKELFNILSTLVTEVRGIKSDVQDIKGTQGEHSQILSEHSQILSEHSRILNEHSRILNEHSRILNEHSRILNRLDAKTDSIADTVMLNDKRLTSAEKEIEELQTRVH